MLSGNGPLVKVLSEVLKQDLKRNKFNLNRPINQVSIETIIRMESVKDDKSWSKWTKVLAGRILSILGTRITPLGHESAGLGSICMPGRRWTRN